MNIYSASLGFNYKPFILHFWFSLGDEKLGKTVFFEEFAGQMAWWMINGDKVAIPAWRQGSYLNCARK